MIMIIAFSLINYFIVQDFLDILFSLLLFLTYFFWRSGVWIGLELESYLDLGVWIRAMGICEFDVAQGLELSFGVLFCEYLQGGKICLTDGYRFSLSNSDLLSLESDEQSDLLVDVINWELNLVHPLQQIGLLHSGLRCEAERLLSLFIVQISQLVSDLVVSAHGEIRVGHIFLVRHEKCTTRTDSRTLEIASLSDLLWRILFHTIS